MDAHDPGVLRAAAERFGDQAGVRRGRRARSRSPTCCDAGAGHRGRAIASLGLGPGGRVVVWAPNSIDWVVAALAVSYAGGTLVPANSRYTGHEVAEIVDRTGAVLVVVAGRLPRPHPGRRPARAASRAAPASSTSSRSTDLGAVASDAEAASTTIARSGLPRRRRRHPVHLRHHRPAQGRDVGAPADRRRRRRLGRARRGHAATTATSWSTRSSTPSATRSASSPACSPARPSTRSRRSTSTTTMALIESERITVLPGAPTIYHVAAQRPRPGRPRPVLAAARRDRRRRRTVVLIERMRDDLADRPRRDGVRDDRGRRGHDVPRRRPRRDRGDHLRPGGPGHGDPDRRRGELLLRGDYVMLGYLDDPARPPRRSTPTAGCTPATSAPSTTPAT